MNQVVLLTEQQYQEIKGKKFAPDCFFYPRQDVDNNWFIDIGEQQECVHPDFQWIKKCPRIEYKPKPIPMPENETPVQE
jgi:hypothetical protein